MFKRVIGIRTNEWSNLEQNLYNQLLQYFSAQEIFVVIDEMKKKVETPQYVQKIYWDSDFIKNNGLLDYNHFNRGIGWLVGDYFYYAFREKVESEYYWLVEPDVGFTFDHLSDFFGVFEEYNDDALLGNFGVREAGDYWNKSANLISDETYGCLFPLSRLSGKAIDVCKLERQRLSSLYSEKNALSYNNNPIGVHFPNDEVLVATTLMREKYQITSFNDVMPHSFSYFNYHQWFSIPQKEALKPLNNVIHPIRPVARFIERLSSEVVEHLEKTKILNYTMVDIDSIESVSNSVGSIVSDYLKKNLSSNFKNMLLMEGVKEYILSVISCYSSVDNKSNVWIWKNKTVVLDVRENNEVLSLDFELNGDNIICYIFERGSDKKDWLNLFEQAYPNLELIGNKGKLFSLPIAEQNTLSTEIEAAIRLLYDFLNNEPSLRSIS